MTLQKVFMPHKGDDASKKDQYDQFVEWCHNQLYSDLYGSAFNMFRDEETAKDAVQSFYEKILRQRTFLESYQKGKSKGDIKGYTLGAAKNFYIDEWNKLKRRREVLETSFDDNNYYKDRKDPLNDKGRYDIESRFIFMQSLSIETEEQLKKLKAAIEQLPEKQKAVVQLRYKGWAHEDIAEKLQITISTSTSRFNRAKEALRDQLNTRSG